MPKTGRSNGSLARSSGIFARVQLDTKGQDTEQDQTKRKFLAEWVNAVNAHGGFDRWRWDVVLQPGALKDVLIKRNERLLEYAT